MSRRQAIVLFLSAVACDIVLVNGLVNIATGKPVTLRHESAYCSARTDDMLSLAVIDSRKYAQFAREFFAADGKPFDEEAFQSLYDRFEGVTWYVQRVLNWIWNKGRGLDGVSVVEEAVANLTCKRNMT